MENQHGPEIALGGGGGGAPGQQGTNGVTVISLAQGLGLEFVPVACLQFLDAPDIARCGAANRFLHKAAGDEGVWRAVRDRLWEGKVFVPASSRAMRTAKEGYLDSLRDSTRTWLDPEELTSFCWWFRFKQQAGEAWTAQDPWYHNRKAPTVDFKHDHTVFRHGDMSLPPAASINWRFVERTGRRTGPTGSFLRVSIGGREVPTYIVSRHPSNWGFLLESCWTVYTSWEMPPKEGPGCDKSLLDDELTVTMDDQWDEAMSFNTGLSFEMYDTNAAAAAVGDNNNSNGNEDGDGYGNANANGNGTPEQANETDQEPDQPAAVQASLQQGSENAELQQQPQSQQQLQEQQQQQQQQQQQERPARQWATGSPGATGAKGPTGAGEVSFSAGGGGCGGGGASSGKSPPAYP